MRFHTYTLFQEGIKKQKKGNRKTCLPYLSTF